jgi:GNAT superfamily N-acetyltransferase
VVEDAAARPVYGRGICSTSRRWVRGSSSAASIGRRASTSRAISSLDSRVLYSLVDEVIRYATKRGYTTINLWTNDVLTAARRIYERAGFTLTNEAPHRAFGHDLVEQTWSLTLTP